MFFENSIIQSEGIFYGLYKIDTTGLRELQLWGDENGVEESFKDVASLAENCKFKDCNHNKEPGCEIKQAIEDGIINQERFESYNLIGFGSGVYRESLSPKLLSWLIS